MKSLLITLGMLGLLAVSTQLFRHVYYGWIVRTDSFLDAYKEKEEKEVAKLKTIEELTAKFDETHKKLKELEKTQKEWRKGKTDEEIRKMPEDLGVGGLVMSDRELTEAISAWERRSEEIRQLHFFWWCGLACLCVGLGSFFWANRWFGIAGMAIGIVEMIYWTSPAFMGGGLEYERLLFWKLVYTGAALFILLVLWASSRLFSRRCN